MAKRKTVSAIQLESAINEVLKEYGNDVYNVLSDAVEEVAEEATNKLKAVDHFAPGREPSGKYSASWTHEKMRSGRLATREVVHNLEPFRLTHLLEKGHVSRNGTQRIFGTVQAYPHIAPVNDWANQELPKAVERKLNGL